MARLTARISDSVEKAKNLDGTKERVSTLIGIGIENGRIVFFSEARIWASRRDPQDHDVHCGVWLHHIGTYQSGHGSAGGSGYHRYSAAMDSALRNAGVHLSEDIDSRGDAAMEAAMVAVGVALGVPEDTILIIPT